MPKGERKDATPDEERVRSVVLALHERWRAGDYEGIGALVDEQVVVAPPGLEARLRGRDAYVQSFRDYDQRATTFSFEVGEPRVDVNGDTAVAVSSYETVFELGSERYEERGHDVLVLSRRSGRWLVVWRTLVPAPAALGDGDATD